MSEEEIFCFSARRICHHDDYFSVINQIRSAINLKDKKTKLKVLLSRKAIVFLDIDGRDLRYIMMILVRGIWGGRGLGISVRTEYLLEKRNLKEFLFRRRRLIFIKAMVKRFLFVTINKFSSTSIISIHKHHKKRVSMEPFILEFINDPQLWDLKILNVTPSAPDEWNAFKSVKDQKLVLVAGRFDEQRCKTELIKYIYQNNKFNFLICGNMEEEDYRDLMPLNNCFIINRYITNEELWFLYSNCDIFYCFYSNDRPSGFFGRAIQMKKPIIVREGQFLHTVFKSYSGLIPVKELTDLDQIDIKQTQAVFRLSKDFDDSRRFTEILKKL